MAARNVPRSGNRLQVRVRLLLLCQTRRRQTQEAGSRAVSAQVHRCGNVGRGSVLAAQGAVRWVDAEQVCAAQVR